MRFHIPLFILAAVQMAVAIYGSIRTDSMVPLAIAGTLAVVTFVVGLLARKPTGQTRTLAYVWTLIILILNVYQIIGTMPGHPPDMAPDSWRLFGIVALAAVWALFRMGIAHSREDQNVRFRDDDE